jgi:Tfp pilus assembly protein PilV
MNNRNFTLIEVVIALGILALGIVTAMGLASASKMRMEKAYAKWKNQHLISQGAEYFLLAGAGQDIPDDLFPYNNYRVSCSLIEPEGLDDAANLQADEWHLKTFKIELWDNRNNRLLKVLKVDKIVNRDDL